MLPLQSPVRCSPYSVSPVSMTIKTYLMPNEQITHAYQNFNLTNVGQRKNTRKHINNLQFTEYSVPCTEYSIPGTVYSVPYTEYRVHSWKVKSMPTPVHTQFGKFCGILPDLLYTRHKILTVNEFQCKSFEYILTFQRITLSSSAGTRFGKGIGLDWVGLPVQSRVDNKIKWGSRACRGGKVTKCVFAAICGKVR